MARRAQMNLDALKAAKPGTIKRPPNSATNGRRGQTLRLPIDSWKRLKTLAVEEETTSHALLVEALNLLFQDRGLPPLV